MSVVLKAYEATIGTDGRLSALPVTFDKPTKVLVTIAIEEEEEEKADLALASEAAFAKDWNREEEDAAWASLQPKRNPRALPF